MLKTVGGEGGEVAGLTNMYWISQQCGGTGSIYDFPVRWTGKREEERRSCVCIYFLGRRASHFFALSFCPLFFIFSELLLLLLSSFLFLFLFFFFTRVFGVFVALRSPCSKMAKAIEAPKEELGKISVNMKSQDLEKHCPKTKSDTGDFDTIIHSINDRLFTFPDDTIVLPGHGLDTTIGAERPHLDEWVDRGW